MEGVEWVKWDTRVSPPRSFSIRTAPVIASVFAQADGRTVAIVLIASGIALFSIFTIFCICKAGARADAWTDQEERRADRKIGYGNRDRTLLS